MLLPTLEELAMKQQRAEQRTQQPLQELQRQPVEQLAKKLRALEINPEEL